MPHLKIRGIEKNLIVENSKEIIDELTKIIGCDRNWFTIEHQNTEYIFDGKIVDGYTFVELYWFARDEKIKSFKSDITDLPLAPKEFIHYYEENDRPQPLLDRDNEKGMQITVGRLREDNLFDYKFVGLSHNTLRGAAGGAVLTAELIKKLGYLD